MRPRLTTGVLGQGMAGGGRAGGQGRGAIINGGKVLLQECNRGEVDSDSSNPSRFTVVTVSFSFAFCEFKKQKKSFSFFFFSFFFFYLSVLRVCFQFVHSLENLCVDFGVSPWNVPGAWVRHKHSLRTLFRNSTVYGISCPPSGGWHPNSQVTVCLSAFWVVHCYPKRGETKAVITDGSKWRWIGGLLNLHCNV